MEKDGKLPTSHKPVCASCNIAFIPMTNGIDVLDITNFGPCTIWGAELWKCPKCNHEIIIEFGSQPLRLHYEKGFNDLISHLKLKNTMYECFEE